MGERIKIDSEIDRRINYLWFRFSRIPIDYDLMDVYVELKWWHQDCHQTFLKNSWIYEGPKLNGITDGKNVSIFIWNFKNISQGQWSLVCSWF